MQPVSHASSYAARTSSTVASFGRLMVLDTELVTCFCQAACIRTCASGLMPIAERYAAGSMPNSRRMSSALCGLSAMRSRVWRAMSSSPNSARSVSMMEAGASSRREPPLSWSFQRTFDHHASAKCGSMPLEHPARRLIVPVGAIVMTLELRTGGMPRSFSAELSYSGKAPRSLARLADSSHAVLLRKPPSASASSSARGESYGTPIRTSASAHPMTPKPMRRVARFTSRSLGSGNSFTLMTSSRKRTEWRTVSSSASQSNAPSRTCRSRLMEPRQQLP